MRSYINLAILALAASTVSALPALIQYRTYGYGNLLVDLKGRAFLISGIPLGTLGWIPTLLSRAESMSFVVSNSLHPEPLMVSFNPLTTSSPAQVIPLTLLPCRILGVFWDHVPHNTGLNSESYRHFLQRRPAFRVVEKPMEPPPQQRIPAPQVEEAPRSASRPAPGSRGSAPRGPRPMGGGGPAPRPATTTPTPALRPDPGSNPEVPESEPHLHSDPKN